MFKLFQIKTLSSIWVLGILLFPQVKLNGQCSGCKTIIVADASTIITINAGEVVCVKLGVTYTGKIILNGGTLCNEGTVSNLKLIQGTFDNYGNYNNTVSSLNISSVNAMRINCYLNSSFLMANSINIASQNTSDSVVFNIYNGAKFSINGNLSINNGVLKIFNALTNPKSPSNIQSYFNIGGQLNVNSSELTLVNYGFGIFNVNKSVNLNAKLNKTINNYGTFNVDNSLTITGNGQNAGVVTVNNYSNFNITKFLNLSYNNGTAIINNNQYKPIPVFQVGKSITISKDNNIFNNYSTLNITQDLIIDRGSVLNSGNLNSRDLTVNNGAYTNNATSVSGRDFIISNSSALINNNGQLFVARQFSNKGTMSFGKASVMVTNNFTNLNGGEIDGPPNLTGAAGPDSSNYAYIDITGFSDNNGNLRNYLVVFDESFSGTGIRLDNYHNNTAKLGIPPVIIGYPPCFLRAVGVTLTSNPRGTICSGTSVVLTAKAFNIFSLTPFPVQKYIWLPSNTITLPPTNTFNTAPLTNNTTFGVQVVLPSGCAITKNITINVSSLLADAGPDKYIFIGATTPIGGSPSATGGTPPYTYLWSPSLNLSNPTIANPVATLAASTTYSLTVSDASGCTSSDNMKIFSLSNQYALLYKKLDGGYYKLANNILYFKTDEEYTTTSLKHKIYDMNNNVIASPVPNTIVSASGDNRYDINFSSYSPGYYILEVTNDKNEKKYLRFKR